MLKLTLLVLLCAAAANAYTGPGTTPKLFEVLMKRCTEFRGIVFDKKLMSAEDRDGLPNCERIATAFVGAFLHKGPCDITQESYAEVIKMTMKSLGKDKVTLWSGVYKYMKQMAKAVGLYALETGTFLGYMGDGLDFCGSKEAKSGLNYDVCPKWGECENGGDAVGNFWKAISAGFAASAEGRVRILMWGTGPRKAYREDSVLGSTELPLILARKKVTSLEPLLAHQPGKDRLETCGLGSMKTMEELIRRNDIQYKCINDPAPLQAVLCLS